MSYGLQISASGVFTALYRQDVFANNLANMDTPGFKVDIPSTRPRDAVREEDGVWHLPSDRLLERLGAGAMLNPNRVSFAQGRLRTTGNALDLGIEGEGFFVVRDQSAGDAQRLTRDGRMTRNAQGLLVLASSGQAVLGEDGSPIALPAGTLTVGADGSLRVNGATFAKLKLVEIERTGELRKLGQGLFEVEPRELAAAKPAGGTVRQHAYEESGVDEVTTLLAMTSASREVETNTWMMREHDRMLDRAINGLGRVA
ncbi:MAG: flagellar hook basal-body protein [Planctomycetota bacterium]|nr:flagellar hook basal-body protein [Planctomycetota bacterium]